MHNLSYLEFYITNVCNLNCTDCQRFNNFSFTGHQRWKDYADKYEAWSKIIHIDSITILGGEPMLNPDFIQWVKGIATFWPISFIRIATNGTQFSRWPELYDILVESKGRIFIEINQHGDDLKETIDKNVRDFLKGEISTTIKTEWEWRRRWKEQWDSVADPSWPYIDDPEKFNDLPQHIQDEYKICCPDFNPTTFKKIHGDTFHRIGTAKHSSLIQDSNGVIIDSQNATDFFDSAINLDTTSNRVFLNNNNPNEAIAVCPSKFCHQFIKGKLYKCPVSGSLPEFIQQFLVETTDRDLDLINSYTPAEYNWDSDKLESFLYNLTSGSVIPQCKFCPTKFDTKRINSGYKKIKIAKIDYN